MNKSYKSKLIIVSIFSALMCFESISYAMEEAPLKLSDSKSKIIHSNVGKDLELQRAGITGKMVLDIIQGDHKSELTHDQMSTILKNQDRIAKALKTTWHDGIFLSEKSRKQIDAFNTNVSHRVDLKFIKSVNDAAPKQVTKKESPKAVALAVSDLREHDSYVARKVAEINLLARRITAKHLKQTDEILAKLNAAPRLAGTDSKMDDLYSKSLAEKNKQRQDSNDLLSHVGTLVDPEFENYKPNIELDGIHGDSITRRERSIRQHLLQNRVEYQARLNKLHEEKYPAVEKLSSEQKTSLLEEIIPSMDILPYSWKEELARQLTGNINR